MKPAKSSHIWGKLLTINDWDRVAQQRIGGSTPALQRRSGGLMKFAAGMQILKPPAPLTADLRAENDNATKSS